MSGHKCSIARGNCNKCNSTKEPSCEKGVGFHERDAEASEFVVNQRLTIRCPLYGDEQLGQANERLPSKHSSKTRVKQSLILNLN